MASPPEPFPPERPVQLRNDLNDLYLLVGDLQNTVQGIAATQQDHGVQLAGLRTDVAELRTDVAELRAGQAELRTDVAELRTGVAELRTDVAELRTGQDEILRLLRGA